MDSYVTVKYRVGWGEMVYGYLCFLGDRSVGNGGEYIILIALKFVEFYLCFGL